MSYDEICVVNDMGTVAHRLKVVIRINIAMTTDFIERHASVSDNNCQLVTNSVGDHDADDDVTFAPFTLTEQVTNQGGNLKHPAIVCCQRVNFRLLCFT